MIDEAIREELVGLLNVQFRGEKREPSELFDLRCEGEAARRIQIVKGLLAEPVSCYEQPSQPVVPQAKREHAVKPLEATLSKVRVSGENDLRVGVRAKPITMLLELFPQLEIVVNLSVEYDPIASLRV